MTSVGAVAIGRNEGERLKRCLRSLVAQADRVAYVDSGSTDGSVAFARGVGVEVVELDTATPFTAARARNAGFAALAAGGAPDLVQFVDGDCAIEPGWIDAARAALDAEPGVGIVTGWRTEVEPARNVFHAMAEVEWRRPPGDVASCGGDMMVRAEAFARVGGFDPLIVASEDEEFCLRLRAATGLRVRRLPRVMTRHDMAMTRAAEWWRRCVRSGHGFAEVGRRHPPHFRAERRRVAAYAVAVPAVALGGAAAGAWWLVALAGLAYGANWARTARGLRRGGLTWRGAAHQAAFLTLSKLPNLQGMLLYHLRRLRRADMRIIEYK